MYIVFSGCATSLFLNSLTHGSKTGANFWLWKSMPIFLGRSIFDSWNRHGRKWWRWCCCYHNIHICSCNRKRNRNIFAQILYYLQTSETKLKISTNHSCFCRARVSGNWLWNRIRSNRSRKLESFRMTHVPKVGFRPRVSSALDQSTRWHLKNVTQRRI